MVMDIVNAKTLLVKGKTHLVTPAGSFFKVQSGESNETYNVWPTGPGFTCDCLWGTKGGYVDPRQSGCSHVQAVVAFQEALRVRTVSSWSTLEDARRQHQPIRDIGNGVVMTSRKGLPQKDLAALRNLLHDGQDIEI